MRIFEDEQSDLEMLLEDLAAYKKLFNDFTKKFDGAMADNPVAQSLSYKFSLGSLSLVADEVNNIIDDMTRKINDNLEKYDA